MMARRASDYELRGGKQRRKRTWLDRRIPGNYKPPPTCIRCGAPVPAARATCETECKPRVVPAPTGEDGTRDG